MRNIVFRGMCMGDGEWVYGNLVVCDGVPYIFQEKDVRKGLDVDGWLNGCRMIEVIPETVGQWTGMVDKNGVMIFEGDILDYNRYIVTYSREAIGPNGMMAGWCIQRDNFESWCYLDDEEEHTVLGNPWKNPELMEG